MKEAGTVKNKSKKRRKLTDISFGLTMLPLVALNADSYATKSRDPTTVTLVTLAPRSFS